MFSLDISDLYRVHINSTILFPFQPSMMKKNQEPRTKNQEPRFKIKKLGTRNTKHGTLNTEHGTRNAEHGTRNAEHRTRNTEHGTLQTSNFKLFKPQLQTPLHHLAYASRPWVKD